MFLHGIILDSQVLNSIQLCQAMGGCDGMFRLIYTMALLFLVHFL